MQPGLDLQFDLIPAILAKNAGGLQGGGGAAGWVWWVTVGLSYFLVRLGVGSPTKPPQWEEERGTGVQAGLVSPLPPLSATHSVPCRIKRESDPSFSLRWKGDKRPIHHPPWPLGFLDLRLACWGQGAGGRGGGLQGHSPRAAASMVTGANWQEDSVVCSPPCPPHQAAPPPESSPGQPRASPAKQEMSRPPRPPGSAACQAETKDPGTPTTSAWAVGSSRQREAARRAEGPEQRGLAWQDRHRRGWGRPQATGLQAPEQSVCQRLLLAMGGGGCV